jgi:hypothetical protein
MAAGWTALNTFALDSQSSTPKNPVKSIGKIRNSGPEAKSTGVNPACSLTSRPHCCNKRTSCALFKCHPESPVFRVFLTMRGLTCKPFAPNLNLLTRLLVLAFLVGRKGGATVTCT